jgi:hypothetical protein
MISRVVTQSGCMRRLQMKLQESRYEGEQ